MNFECAHSRCPEFLTILCILLIIFPQIWDKTFSVLHGSSRIIKVHSVNLDVRKVTFAVFFIIILIFKLELFKDKFIFFFLKHVLCNFPEIHLNLKVQRTTNKMFDFVYKVKSDSMKLKCKLIFWLLLFYIKVWTSN